VCQYNYYIIEEKQIEPYFRKFYVGTLHLSICLIISNYLNKLHSFNLVSRTLGSLSTSVPSQLKCKTTRDKLNCH